MAGTPDQISPVLTTEPADSAAAQHSTPVTRSLLLSTTADTPKCMRADRDRDSGRDSPRAALHPLLSTIAL